MAWERLAAASMVLLLAGCFGDDGGALPPVDVGPDEVETNASRDVRPDGRDGTFAAFDETNATENGAGGVDHHHDYWEGRSRAVILETEGFLIQRAPRDGSGAVYSYGRLPLDQQARVWEGTARVEVTLSNPERRACEPVFTLNGRFLCTDEATGVRAPDPEGGPKGIHLYYVHAATSTWIDAGEVVWGSPLAIVVADPKHTDMPHAVSSYWAFELRSAEVKEGTLTFDAKIELVRAEGEIPIWPGHPDFYTEGHSRVVLDASATLSQPPITDNLLASYEEPPSLVPEKLISYGTRTLYVFVNITDVRTSNPAAAPTQWTLVFRNATGIWDQTDFTDDNHTGTVREHLWVLRVTDDGMDSPYADASRWAFRLTGSFGLKAGDAFSFGCGGFCSTYEVDHTMTIVATDLESEAYSP